MGRLRRLRRHPAKKCLMRFTYLAYGVRYCRPDKALAPPSGEEMPDAFHLSGLRGTLL
ncbi:hypothetical protein [Citrobacter arsenatis]|uniref:hypothetical protein n=1 Tax=Citrobacter arsenatis TaxID=2546350 RepID=UPI00140477CF|nr:hypothetical protein [Citrobacter arsenatis]